MKTFDFELHLDLPECTEDLAELIYEAGFNDSTLSSRSGSVYLSVSREANTLLDALASAVAALNKLEIKIVKATLCD